MEKLNLMNRGKLTGAIALLACLFCLAGVANSTIIYDNLGSSYAGYDPLTGWTDAYGRVLSPALYDSFSVGADSTNLLDVQLMLRGSPSSGSFSVSLYSDSSASPGKLLCTIGTLSDNALPLSWSVVDLSLASPYDLAADTRYWLVLNSTNSSTAEWSWSPDQEALGVAGEYCGHGGWVYENTAGPYQMRLIVPLPGAVWFLGAGLAGLGLWRGRKLFKA